MWETRLELPATGGTAATEAAASAAETATTKATATTAAHGATQQRRTQQGCLLYTSPSPRD